MLAEPLSGVSAPPVGVGHGDTFIIAGYGTPDEHERGAFGALREATLVAAGARALVDPNRTGSIGASACFGDSGGPVMRGGMLSASSRARQNPTETAALSLFGNGPSENADIARATRRSARHHHAPRLPVVARAMITRTALSPSPICVSTSRGTR